ncbi:MAG: hypothetical protein ACXVEF_26295 [Polyangiales bacterium]
MKEQLARLRNVPQATLVELFVVSNIAFLAVDIALAHAENQYARADEWIPIVFSVVATLLLLPGAASARIRESTVPLAIAVAAASIVIGLAGMIVHLESAFFREQSLKNLVYTAPFAAPLAYVGLGLLLLLTRLERPGSAAWASWIAFLALGGFVGNLALSLLDHAQNGFNNPAEWLSVIAAAFGTSFLAVAVLWPSTTIAKAGLAVMALEAAVGVLGFVLHTRADLAHKGSLAERFIHGAPAFAPLLFADLAVLGAIAFASMIRDQEATARGGRMREADASAAAAVRTTSEPS